MAKDKPLRIFHYECELRTTNGSKFSFKGRIGLFAIPKYGTYRWRFPLETEDRENQYGSQVYGNIDKAIDAFFKGRLIFR
jgi:hypothetical protein